MTKRSAGYIVLALVLFIAGCGSPTAGPPSAAAPGSSAAQKVYDQINGLSGDQRTQTLLDLAKKDGQLSLYTSNTDIDDVVKAFEAKYGLKVETYRANSETVLQRILQESSAHYQGADIVETNAGELNDLQQQKLLSAYKGALRDKVRPEGRKDGWTADRFNAFVVGWNTNKVAPGTEPKTLKDLAGPQWKGRVGFELGDVDWYAAMYDYYKSQGMSDADVNATVHQPGAQREDRQGSHRDGRAAVRRRIRHRGLDLLAHRRQRRREGRTGDMEDRRQAHRTGGGAAQRCRPADVGEASGGCDAVPRLPAHRRPGRDRRSQPDRRDPHRRRPAGRSPDRLGSRERVAQRPAEVE